MAIIRAYLLSHCPKNYPDSHHSLSAQIQKLQAEVNTLKELAAQGQTVSSLAK